MPPRFVFGNHMNILIVGPSWVGDMVMAQTLFQCLKQRHPQCEIDVLAPEWSRPILERMPASAQGLELPARPRRAGIGDASAYRQIPASVSTIRRSCCPTR